ncbi:MBL fold metallo-hydrolase [Azospirillum sp. SYSU D00513]|uniref:MBL fold metallo-hydrolase n=1 Tax=Azospirillum sp. SYSU D00513 TaxID=2812561 RepID=UPI001A970AE5|nr:MBL fold metallo-hydrolase [Azospirillum sp. SYSU D00513]
MPVQIAERWFEARRIDDDITLLWEPHVVPLLRCNIWHVRGRDRDLLVDTGMGICSLKEAARDLFDKPLVAAATHTHTDHVGGHHEFEDCLVHRLEADRLAEPRGRSKLHTRDSSPEEIRKLREAGYEVGEELVTALPHAGYDIESYRVRPARPSRIVEEGDTVDLGGRRFEILHLPGHSPGGIGLWEAATGTLFSGDAIYDGPLLDDIPGADVEAYVATMERLKRLPVTVVHAGHDPSFGRERLVELADAYLARRRAA